MISNRKDLLAHIAAHPVDGSVEDMRAAFLARLDPPEDLGREADMGGTSGLVFGDGPVTGIFLHGGGYVLGSPRAQARLVHRLSEYSGLTLFSAGYPTAPEHVWPAPLKTVLTLIDSFKTPLRLIGGSAGGHLALNAALARPDRISKLVLFSPNTDRTGRSHTRRSNTPCDAMNSDAGDRKFFEMSMPDVDPNSVAASPLLGDLARLPPTFISATRGEVLLGDSLLLARAMRAAGICVESVITEYAEAGLHMFESWPHILPAGDAALRRTAAFIAKA